MGGRWGDGDGDAGHEERVGVKLGGGRRKRGIKMIWISNRSFFYPCKIKKWIIFLHITHSLIYPLNLHP